MPEISRFFGIILSMYHNEHPPPHFHARYGQQKVIVDIQTFAVLEGQFSPRLRGVEWVAIHQHELLENWQLAKQYQPLKKITPLE